MAGFFLAPADAYSLWPRLSLAETKPKIQKKNQDIEDLQKFQQQKLGSSLICVLKMKGKMSRF